MNIILFDTPSSRQKLLPFTYTRPAAELRVGILTIAKKWALWLKTTPSYLTEDYLSIKYPVLYERDNLYIAGNLCPNKKIVAALSRLKTNQKLVKEGVVLASRQAEVRESAIGNSCEPIEFLEQATLIVRTWHIFKNNGDQIRLDFELITKGRKSQPLEDPFTRAYAIKNIFIEKGANIKDATLNAEKGPIYIGKQVIIEEGSVIRGPSAICEHSTVNSNAYLRGDTTIGPWSKVGGEISNTIIFGYSNKGHGGFLGNSVLGEWCNIGADTNTSNLKNNYSLIKVWDYEKEEFIDTGEQFFGIMMGDHSKCGINTMFNTGTSIGVATNTFGAGFLRPFIPSFSWGGVATGYTTFKVRKVVEMASISMKRRNISFDDQEKQILLSIFKKTVHYRSWEKSNEV